MLRQAEGREEYGPGEDNDGGVREEERKSDVERCGSLLGRTKSVSRVRREGEGREKKDESAQS